MIKKNDCEESKRLHQNLAYIYRFSKLIYGLPSFHFSNSYFIVIKNILSVEV